MARIFVALASLLFCCRGHAEERARLPLDGLWQFRTDPQSVGVREEWHSPGVTFPGQMQVPGIWQSQDIGPPSGNLRHNYTGPAWYRRTIAVPASWQGKVIHLRIGGALRHTTVFVNGRKAGEHDGFSTPFRFDVTEFIRPGADNTIAFRIVNPDPPTSASPDVQTSTQPTGMLNYVANWGGVYGTVTLEASNARWIDDLVISPDIARQRAMVSMHVRGTPMEGAQIEVTVGSWRAVQSVSPEGLTTLALPMPGHQLWSPDNPLLYTAAVRLLQNGRELDRTEQRFGMREITTQGRVLLLNGKPLYLRGYGDDNIEVLTGVAPSSKQKILERIKLAREFGFNAVRYHSMIPSEAFFEAADEAGLLVMAELPAAYTMHFLPHRDYLKRELESALRLYRNHPSFLSLAFGNEFNLGWLKTDAEKQEFQKAIREFYDFAKSIDPKRLILSNDGLELRPSDMFSLYTGAPEDAPTVRHEFGNYYCSLPDVGLISKFTGVLKPTWLEQKKEWIDKNGLAAVYPSYLQNSWRLQQLGRKFEIERVRRQQNVSGYHYWLAVDYPGGTGEGDSWEEGWFDYFWRPKGIEAREGRELNSPVLLMIGAGVERRTVWNDEVTPVDVLVSNYGPDPIANGTISWRINDEKGVVQHRGSLGGIQIGLGKVQPAGRIELPPLGGTAARKLELVVELQQGKTTYTNRWNYWVFPHNSLLKSSAVPVRSDVRWRALKTAYPFIDFASTSNNDGILVTQSLTPDALAFLNSGGRVLLLSAEGRSQRDGSAHFFPASGGAFGTSIANHPALQGFPHDGLFDLQFYNLLEGAGNFALDSWPGTYTPIAGSFRTTSSFLSKSKQLSRTGYLFEARVGQGRLLVSTLRLLEHYDEAFPEAIWLVDCLLRYVTSDAFQPQLTATSQQLRPLIAR